MKKYFPIMEKSPLFRDIAPQSYPALLQTLQARSAFYAQGCFVLRQGERLPGIGLIISGQIDILREDFWGNAGLVNRIEAGHIFGETYACLNLTPEVSVAAAKDSEVLFLQMNAFFANTRTDTDSLLLQRNLLLLFAERSLQLTRKIGYLSCRSTREKLLSYLSGQAALQGSSSITIPFNRQQLADFLSVERSALSAELSHMQKDGLIQFRKNQFQLLVPQ